MESENQPTPPVSADVVSETPQPQRPAPAPRGGSRLFTLFLLVASIGLNALLFVVLIGSLVGNSFDDSRLIEKHHSGQRGARDKIAILTVEGVMMQGEGSFVKKQIDQIRKDDNVKAIVLRVDSPGGLVNSADYMYHHLNELIKDRELPIVVSMGDIAASGGYYVSMAVGEYERLPSNQNKDLKPLIFAEPTSWTGSIGVLIPHYDLSGLAAKYDVHEDSIKSHPLKAMGSMLKEMSPQERAIFQELVDEMFNHFKDVVKSGRDNLDDAKITEVATGQIFTATQAKAHGLVDKIDYIEGAIDRAAELAGLDLESADVIKYKAQPTLTDVLMGTAQAQQSRGMSLDLLIESSVPRPYYLCSWMPSLTAVKQ